MNFIYASNICSNEKIIKLFSSSKEKPAIQGIKYNKLLAEGLAKKNNTVTTISAVQMSRKINKRIFFRSEKEFGNELNYNYLPFINLPIIRHIFLFVFSFMKTLFFKAPKESGDLILIGDILSVAVSSGAFLAAKLRRVKCIAVVTDVPVFQNNTERTPNVFKFFLYSMIRRIRELFMSGYDGYILLTEQMNALVNPNKRPYIVIEGLVDIEMTNVKNNLEEKYKETVIVYAGALEKKYGIHHLLNAFMKLDDQEARLWIFGKGEMVTEIQKLESLDHRIKYHGMVPNEEVVTAEVKATLLVNPRPINDEYTKYSFPSKTTEYMVSGTPVLTTKLPGIPSNYNQYLYFIENETVEEDLLKALKNVLIKSKHELHQQGLNAREFVLKEKNNVAQASKLVEIIKEKVL